MRLVGMNAEETVVAAVHETVMLLLSADRQGDSDEPEDGSIFTD